MTFQTLLNRLSADFPAVRFAPGAQFCWSPRDQTVYYVSADTQDPSHEMPATALWTLLHELSHADLMHDTYRSDFELLRLEAAAWDRARQLAANYGVTIDPGHIQDCLDTYREWLHARSTCPVCGINAVQTDAATYRCANCRSTWQVSASRFCRPYRRSLHRANA